MEYSMKTEYVWYIVNETVFRSKMFRFIPFQFSDFHKRFSIVHIGDVNWILLSIWGRHLCRLNKHTGFVCVCFRMWVCVYWMKWEMQYGCQKCDTQSSALIPGAKIDENHKRIKYERGNECERVFLSNAKNKSNNIKQHLYLKIDVS